MGKAELSTLKSAEASATALINAARDERKVLLKRAQADAKREIDEYRAAREAKLRAALPEAQALEAKVARVTAETDRKIAALEAEYNANKEKVLQLVMQVVMNTENPFNKA